MTPKKIGNYEITELCSFEWNILTFHVLYFENTKTYESFTAKFPCRENETVTEQRIKAYLARR